MNEAMCDQLNAPWRRTREARRFVSSVRQGPLRSLALGILGFDMFDGGDLGCRLEAVGVDDLRRRFDAEVFDGADFMDEDAGEDEWRFGRVGECGSKEDGEPKRVEDSGSEGRCVDGGGSWADKSKSEGGDS